VRSFPDEAAGYEPFKFQVMNNYVAIKNSGFLLLMLVFSCAGSTARESDEKMGSRLPRDTASVVERETDPFPWVSGAEKTNAYLGLLEGRLVGLVANPTSVVRNESGQWVHLVDTLLNSGVEIAKVFSPEHGFRGTADAGEKVESGRDPKSGLTVVSLYGSQRKPARKQLTDLDVLVFDIQDVGVRFYTYIATLQLVMEAASEAGKPLIVLDRPNPHGNTVDGPVLESELSSFLGLNPIPLVYGLTIGEYAQLVKGEGWIQGAGNLDLTVIPCSNYRHADRVRLPIPPSPNLPDDRSIALYPSLGLFEGTYINAGRGTEAPFQQFGASFLDPSLLDHTYVPVAVPGAKNPKQLGQICYGRDLREYPLDSLQGVQIEWLLEAYAARRPGNEFFKRASFAKHSGTSWLQDWIEEGRSAGEIRRRWAPELKKFRKTRARYLLYP